jgi:TatD DNase family protein
MFVDSHCHLDFPDFREDFPDVLARARSAGIGAMVTIGTRLSAFADVLAIAEREPSIYCSVGVHPHNADQEGVDNPEALIEHAQHRKVVGIGETGLDFYYRHSAPERQAHSFRAHIAAARQTALPLIVHTRNADAETIDILSRETGVGAFSGVIHCFSASAALAERALALGLYISFSGILTFRNAREVQDVAKSAPLDRVLLETDAPYLAPVPRRGKRNEPALLVHTAAFLAQLRGEGIERIAEVTSANFFRLFAKVPVIDFREAWQTLSRDDKPI